MVSAHERGFVQGITHSASRLGAAIAPPHRRVDHHHAWLALGISTSAARSDLVWAVWWYFAYRNLPEEHGMVNEDELKYIRGADAQGNAISARSTSKPERAVGNTAAIAQYVGDHVRLFHLRVLPLDLPQLAAVLSGGIQAFHADQGRPVCVAAAVRRRGRRYGRRPGDRLAADEDRQHQDSRAGRSRSSAYSAAQCSSCRPRSPKMPTRRSIA